MKLDKDKLINSIDWNLEARKLSVKSSKIDLAREVLMLRMGINISIISSSLLSDIDSVKKRMLSKKKYKCE